MCQGTKGRGFRKKIKLPQQVGEKKIILLCLVYCVGSKRWGRGRNTVFNTMKWAKRKHQICHGRKGSQILLPEKSGGEGKIRKEKTEKIGMKGVK